MLLKKKENQETGGDTDETGAKTEKTHNFLLCDCADRHSAVKSSAFPETSRAKSNRS